MRKLTQEELAKVLVFLADLLEEKPKPMPRGGNPPNPGSEG